MPLGLVSPSIFLGKSDPTFVLHKGGERFLAHALPAEVEIVVKRALYGPDRHLAQ